jgi:hypothetical protein
MGEIPHFSDFGLNALPSEDIPPFLVEIPIHLLAMD